MNELDNAAKPVTIVIQTRITADMDAAFAAWLRRISAVVASQPGFVTETVMPPSPPAQLDWVILQRFASVDAATAWLRAEQRQRLVAEVQPMLVGSDDVHLVADAGAGALPAPVSAVISTRIKPGQEPAFLEWGRRIAAAQAKYPGFQGYRREPPVPGVQEDWLTILRFDSQEHLDQWLNSPERKKLLEESVAFTDTYHVRTVRTGFDQWFDVPGSAPPSAWKQDMTVLLVLYPVVFLLNEWLQKPILVGIFGLPYWAFLFVNIVVGVMLLSLILPHVSRLLGWWLRPPERDWKADLAGAALVAVFYTVLLMAAWQYQTWFGTPFPPPPPPTS
jgi:antibiotic biosynthesis monooxygenase (ABM) superfamily enzyme